MPPARLTRPYVGRSPVTPQNADGQRIDPQVSVPMAKPTSAEAVAAPEPEEEPPVHRSGSQGFRPGPWSEASAKRYPKHPANSTIASLPSSTAPASRSFRTTVASLSRIWSLVGAAPHVVRIPAVARRSFAPYGIP